MSGADRAVPAATLAALARYLDRGLAPGGFLSAVIENDLRSACALADPENLAALTALVQWMEESVPSLAWGYEGVIDDYRANHLANQPLTRIHS